MKQDQESRNNETLYWNNRICLVTLSNLSQDETFNKFRTNENEMN